MPKTQEPCSCKGTCRGAEGLSPGYICALQMGKPEQLAAGTGCECEACERDGQHWSDCAVHNEPAFPNGPCNCRNRTSELDRNIWAVVSFDKVHLMNMTYADCRATVEDLGSDDDLCITTAEAARGMINQA